MKYVDVVASEDIAGAAWIGPRLMPFRAHCAGSVVPGGFEAYVRVDHPRAGVLSVGVAAALVGVVGRHTAAPGSSWLALWDGYGYVDVESGGGRGWAVLKPPSPGSAPAEAPPPDPPWRIPPQRPRSAPRLQLPARAYVLYRGALDSVPGWEDGPNLWWPDDRAWCVATEIDLPWTYVGGTQSLAEDLMANATVAAKPIQLDETWPSGGRPG